MTDVEPGKAKAAGIVGILIGLTALANIVCGCIYAGLGGKDGSGLWSGFGQAAIAALGIVTWVKLNRMAFVFNLVLCILWLIICIVQVVVGLIAWLVWAIIKAILDAGDCYQSGDLCVCRDERGNVQSFPVDVHDCGDISTIISCVVAIVIVSAIAVILIFAGSIIGCMGVCRAKPQTNVVVVQQPGMVMTTQQHGAPPPEYPAKY